MIYPCIITPLWSMQTRIGFHDLILVNLETTPSYKWYQQRIE